MKLLIVKRDKIGDMLLTTPLLAHLRAHMPQAQIHVLANDYNAWVLSGNPDVDKVWTYRRTKHGNSLRWTAPLHEAWLVLQHRLLGFDAVLVGNGTESQRAIKRGIRAGARRVVAYCEDASRYPGLTDPLPQQASRHEAINLAALAEPLGIPLPASLPFPRYLLPEDAEDFATHWLRERGLERGKYVVLGLGARRAKKQPATEQIVRWATAFKREMGLDTVFMWTPGRSDNPLYPGDDEVAQPVLDTGLPHLHPFRGALQPALGLIWGARTSLFPDSGLMHFAAASPGGVLGFFAETDVSPSPVQWAPLGRNVDWLEAERAISGLPDDLVLSRVERLVAGSGR
ncbi:MAG: hypothetical protein OHM77_10255 [Candidatus Nitricoxidivorans perseverans]|uniref:Lipopolysaccharide heptosyltransferase family protein n=1 Tax=Candidatus Nitricoxidivorans perseverans TaxID=2975601 RepID=A0AA49FJW0_9PROT|nr:MAG: hypothetical protein OHM77_10255 [Candidatus Nitricoxidivorans perseverans]